MSTFLYKRVRKFLHGLMIFLFGFSTVAFNSSFPVQDDLVKINSEVKVNIFQASIDISSPQAIIEPLEDLSTKAISSATILYVSTAGYDAYTCTSISYPCRTIQAAINKASSGDTVHAASGTYAENISMKSGVSVIGESPSNTIIMGAALVQGVVYFSNITQATLRGFRITVDSPRPGYDRGISIYGNSDSTTIIENNIILGVQYGMFIMFPAAPIVQNNTFIGLGDEQGIYIGNDGNFSPIIRSNIITGYKYGLHVVDDGTQPTATPSPIIAYNDLWSNENNYASIPDQTGFYGNLSINPLFVDPATRNYHLSGCSLAIDAGDPSSLFANEPAPNGGRIDIGAYGNTPEATSHNCVVPPSAPTGVNATDGIYTDRIRVSWSASGGATYYKVYRNTTNSSAGVSLLESLSGSPYDDISAGSGRSYWYFVKACNTSGCSGFSSSNSGYRDPLFKIHLSNIRR